MAIVFENFHHQSGVIGDDDSRLLHAQEACVAFRLTKGPARVYGDIGILSLAHGRHRWECGADLERKPREDQLFTSQSFDRVRNPLIVKCVN
jgi:hypothetical protein